MTPEGLPTSLPTQAVQHDQVLGPGAGIDPEPAESRIVDKIQLQPVLVVDPGDHASPALDIGAGIVHLVGFADRDQDLAAQRADQLRELPAQLFAEREWILDAKLLTEEMLAEGKGYARLLGSSFSPPLKVWERAE